MNRFLGGLLSLFLISTPCLGFEYRPAITQGGLSGTVGVSNGGTGLSTITGYVKGTGTAALSTSPTIPTADLSGVISVSNGGTGANLSATGGTSQVLQQTSVGGTVSVGQLAASNLSNGTTGSGAVVLATSPTLVTPVLGTPSSGTLTSCTGLPLTTGVTGVLSVTNGGTGATTSAAARTSLGAAGSGSNSDITSLTSLTGVSVNGTVTANSVGVNGLTASRAIVSDSSKNLSSSTVTSTELGYVSGVTSALQTQLNNKAASGANSDITSLTGLSSITSTVTCNKGVAFSFSTLTDAATVAIDLSQSCNFNLTLGGNRTLGVPTNIVPGQSGVITVRQDITGSRTLAYAWPYVFVGGAAPTLSTGKLVMDQLNYIVNGYNTGTVTMTIATPCVVTWTGHGLTSGQRVQFTTTGALPTGISASTTYWVTVIDANTFNLSTSLANAQSATFVATSGTQSGVHTAVNTSITLTLNNAIN